MSVKYSVLKGTVRTEGSINRFKNQNNPHGQECVNQRFQMLVLIDFLLFALPYLLPKNNKKKTLLLQEPDV